MLGAESGAEKYGSFGGPGRSGNRNFVLQEVRVERLAAGADQWEPLELASARSDFEQDTAEGGGARYAVAGALPGSGAPGWAAQCAVQHVL